MSLSDISDLTDLSEEEDDVPLSRRSSKAKKGPKEYKITHVLRAPRTAQYTARSLYDQIIDNSIDLDPDYQRDVVWQEEKQSGLIDSILRNYYIPPIIFAVTIQDDGSEMRTCIDGKQRLTSIQRFIDGQIPHKDSFTSERLWFKSSVGNARRKLLPQHLRTLFANKQIVCVEYTGLDNNQEREIFQRVQLGVALTPAERLQALVGPWSTVIHEIQHEVLGEEGFEGYLDWGHTRGRDFQCLATMCYLIEDHPKTSVPQAKTLEKWLQKPEPVPNHLRADLHETFRIFVTLARDKKYSGSLNRPTRVSPIEFVIIGLLIYLRRKSLSLTQISSAIEKMRKDVRASHQDIRSNARVTKHLVDFIKRIKVSELRSDGEGDKPAAQAVAKAAKPVKRKRRVDSDESDSEPIRTKSAKQPTLAVPIAATKPPNEITNKSFLKTNGVKKVPPPIKPIMTTKPPPTSRMTNNSLSSLASLPPAKLLPTMQMPHKSPPPIPSTLNGYNAHSGSTASNPARGASRTIQGGSTVKVESPQMNSLNSPVASVDRLAPIRAVKASLSVPGSQAPGSDVRAVGPRANVPQTLPNYSQKTSVPLPSPPILSQQQPLPLPPVPLIPPSQPPPPFSQPTGDARQGRVLPPQVEGALRALRMQFPQLNGPGPSPTSETASPTAFGPNGHSAGMSPTLPLPNSTPGYNGDANGSGYMSQGYGAPQGNNGGVRTTQVNVDQSRPYMTSSWSSSKPGDAPSQQPMNLPTPTSTSPSHTLPPRPMFVVNAPNNSMRAEPLGPPPRSASSESSAAEGRRGSYLDNRRRPSDDRRASTSTLYDHNQDANRNKRDSRDWSYRRS